MPDISMRQLNDDEVEDLRDVSLADAIKEARRGQQVNQNQQRDATNTEFDEQLAAIMTTPAANAPSTSEKNNCTKPRCTLRFADKQTGISPCRREKCASSPK